MSDADSKWSTEVPATQPGKRRLPGWLWGCGIGCGLLLVLGLLLAFLGYRSLARMQDPERQWAALEEVLEVVERPADFELAGLPWWVLRLNVKGCRSGWVLSSTDEASMGTIMSFEADPAHPTWQAFFDPTETAWHVGLFGHEGFHDPELGTLLVQGRELRVLRYRTMPAEQDSEPEPEAQSEDAPGSDVFRQIWAGVEAAMRASVAHVDITPEPAGSTFLALEYRRPGSLERVSDEELVAFLESFDLSAD